MWVFALMGNLEILKVLMTTPHNPKMAPLETGPPPMLSDTHLSCETLSWQPQTPSGN